MGKNYKLVVGISEDGEIVERTFSREPEMRKTFIEYKHVIHNTLSGISHPKGTPLISVLNEEGSNGWIVCGMIKDDRPRERTDIYFYREVIVEEL